MLVAQGTREEGIAGGLMKSVVPFARRAFGLLGLALLAPQPVTANPASMPNLAAVRARLPQDEIIYFLLPDRFDNGDPSNDRGGLTGGPLQTGFDPTNKGFYHGGDLKGVIRRLDYIQALGATAIWVGPIFKNKAVQGPAGHESAGYHGYWIEDFLHVDPHFGTDADFKILVDAAHARGLKVYMDIVVNHTADVIQYRECQNLPCPYRSRADYPYTLKAGDPTRPINPSFQGDSVQTAGNFAHLTDPDWAYTPFVPAGEAHIKNPDWLNDPIYYHNRGNSTFAGESSTMGDFFGLDDVMTEHPRVIAGMIDIYGSWIDRFGVDGFRIDTEQHVNPEFWQAFVPAMLAKAKARGIPNFHVFGEVSIGNVDPARLAEHTQVDRIPAVLDFAFMHAVIDTVGGNAGTDELARLFAADPLYRGGEAAAEQLPTFLGNHDQGRFAMFVRKARPNASDAEVLARTILGHAMLLTLRGVPTIYSGDEQGFAGNGDDQEAREDLFASKVASYNAETLVGSKSTTAVDNFNPRQPIYRAIAALAKIREATSALRRGRQFIRAAGEKPGLFAVSRFDPTDGHEVLIAFNTSGQPLSAKVEVNAASRRWVALAGTCAEHVWATGSVAMNLPAYGYAVCEARR
jgi:glycosidase